MSPRTWLLNRRSSGKPGQWRFHGVWGGVGGECVMIGFFDWNLRIALHCLFNRDDRQKCTTFNAKPARRPQINRNSNPVPRWRGCSVSRGPGEPVQPMRALPSLPQFERRRPSWSDQLCRQEKRWISPEIDPLIDESCHRSGYMANCFHKRNWKVVKSQTGWRMVYLWEENTRRFVREILICRIWKSPFLHALTLKQCSSSTEGKLIVFVNCLIRNNNARS